MTKALDGLIQRVDMFSRSMWNQYLSDGTIASLERYKSARQFFSTLMELKKATTV